MQKLPYEQGTVKLYKEKMNALEQQLILNQINFKKILYPFFTFGYLSFGVKNPSFFSLAHQEENGEWCIVGYSAEEDMYAIHLIHKYQTVEVPNMSCTDDFYDGDAYCMSMLEYACTLLETSQLSQIVAKTIELAPRNGKDM